MIQENRLIFGKKIHFRFDKSFKSILLPSIELYPNIASGEADVEITIVPEIKRGFLSRNPSEFSKGNRTIKTRHNKGEVSWCYDDLNNKLFVELTYKLQPTDFLGKVRRFRSMEYATEPEIFQQILHEAILVSSMYFFKDRAIIHSAVLGVDDEAILLAGTGGVGKTSASLSLRKNSRISFIADDIAVLSDHGSVFPNLAWPKVYGYNLSSYITKQELLEGRGLIDKIQFDFKVKRNPKRVRRKMKPDILYNKYHKEEVQIKKVVYLFRDDCKEMYLTPLDKNLSIEMGIHIMKTEYSKLLHNNLEWDRYNSIALNIKPILKLENVFDNWRDSLSKAFINVEVQLLHIPFDLPHEDYLKTVHKYILK